MTSLIINADDVGLSDGINEAVKACYSKGIITGVSVIACGGSFREGAAMLREAARTEVGAHLALTGAFRPCTEDLSKVNTLVSKDGRFPRDYWGFFRRYSTGRISSGQIRLELENQIKRLKAEGLEITHLDSHEHVHVFPGVFGIVLDLARENGVPYVRSASEDPVVIKKDFRLRDLARYAILKAFAVRAGKRLERSGLGYNDRFLGHFHSGRINGDILLYMAENMSDGLFELAVHPGIVTAELLDKSPWHANAQAEMEALMNKSWRKLLEVEGVRLVTHMEAVS